MDRDAYWAGLACVVQGSSRIAASPPCQRHCCLWRGLPETGLRRGDGCQRHCLFFWRVFPETLPLACDVPLGST